MSGGAESHVLPESEAIKNLSKLLSISEEQAEQVFLFINDKAKEKYDKWASNTSKAIINDMETAYNLSEGILTDRNSLQSANNIEEIRRILMKWSVKRF